MKPESTAQIPEVPLVNEMRLNARLWCITLALLVTILFLTPRLWQKVEKFPTGEDYRIPYQLSKDYWLYQRRLEQVTDPKSIFILGDSVVWGEYVQRDGTLSHFLNQVVGASNLFINAGVNGLFPIALDGLVDSYANALRNRKVIVQCNLLWMSSPRADLSIEKEERFNHSRLVPQFHPLIPSYRADANERLSAVIEHHVRFSSWVNHLQTAYFGDKSIPAWTLQDDGVSDPPHYPNTYKNPFSKITLAVPVEPPTDPLRGPVSARHKAWNSSSNDQTQFEWVDIEHSLQWQAFQRLVKKLRSRGNEVLVILGPFNEHLIAPETLPAFQALQKGITAWFSQEGFTCLQPPPLPSPLYADASHPLTEGYQLLAKTLATNVTFRNWISQ